MAKQDENPNQGGRLLFTDFELTGKGRPSGPALDNVDAVPLLAKPLPSIDDLLSNLDLSFEADDDNADGGDGERSALPEEQPDDDVPPWLHSEAEDDTEVELPAWLSGATNDEPDPAEDGNDTETDTEFNDLPLPSGAQEETDDGEDIWSIFNPDADYREDDTEYLDDAAGEGDPDDAKFINSLDQLLENLDSQDDLLSMVSPRDSRASAPPLPPRRRGRGRGRTIKVPPPRPIPYGGIKRLDEWYRPPEENPADAEDHKVERVEDWYEPPPAKGGTGNRRDTARVGGFDGDEDFFSGIDLDREWHDRQARFEQGDADDLFSDMDPGIFDKHRAGRDHTDTESNTDETHTSESIWKRFGKTPDQSAREQADFAAEDDDILSEIHVDPAASREFALPKRKEPAIPPEPPRAAAVAVVTEAKSHTPAKQEESASSTAVSDASDGLDWAEDDEPETSAAQPETDGDPSETSLDLDALVNAAGWEVVAPAIADAPDGPPSESFPEADAAEAIPADENTTPADAGESAEAAVSAEPEEEYLPATADDLADSLPDGLPEFENHASAAPPEHGETAGGPGEFEPEAAADVLPDAGQAEPEAEPGPEEVAVNPLDVFANMDAFDNFDDDGLDDEMRAMLAEDEAAEGDAAAPGGEGGAATQKPDIAPEEPAKGIKGKIQAVFRKVGGKLFGFLPAEKIRHLNRMLSWRENWRFYCDLLAALIATASLAVIASYFLWYRN